MPFEYVPQDRFIVNSLVKMIAASAHEQPSYDTAIGFGVEEVVRHNLRQLAQERAGMRGAEDLLDAAVHRSAGQLQHELDSRQLAFDLAPYLDHARESLDAASKEMNSLNRKLIESRQQKRIGEKTPVTTVDARRLYEVSELGLLESIEALLATPTSDVTALDIDRIRQEFPTDGEWFPFEVKVDDLLLVIDDDGSVFISTENFPREVMDRARSVLHRIAEMLYSERGDRPV